MNIRRIIQTSFLLLTSNLAYAADTAVANIECDAYIQTAESVMQERQTGKGIKELVDLAIERKNQAKTSEDIELSNFYSAYILLAYKEPIGKTDQEKQDLFLKSKVIGKMFCDRRQQKQFNN